MNVPAKKDRESKAPATKGQASKVVGWLITSANWLTDHAGGRTIRAASILSISILGIGGVKLLAPPTFVTPLCLGLCVPFAVAAGFLTWGVVVKDG